MSRHVLETIKEPESLQMSVLNLVLGGTIFTEGASE